MLIQWDATLVGYTEIYGGASTVCLIKTMCVLFAHSLGGIIRVEGRPCIGTYFES